jgi:hypothetical protein
MQGEQAVKQTSADGTESVPDDLAIFLEKLSSDKFKGKSGNKSLREALGWAENVERYWAAHGRALDAGKVAKGGGKGGSVRLITEGLIDDEAAEGVDATIDDELGVEKPKESDLYPPANKVIAENWVKSENFDDYLVETTAAKGSAATGGKWTRPDISILATKAFPYLPNRIFEIVTFEIKPAGQTTVEGVFEALSHQQFGTRSYVVFHLSDPDIAENFVEKQPYADRILATARRHGIGVIITTKIEDWDTWDVLVEAERNHPDPEQSNRFIATCFSEEAHQTVIKWHK